MATIRMARPEASEHAPYYGRYIDLVADGDIVATLASQLAQALPFLRGITEGHGNTRHAPYTWSIKEVIGHLIDTERIFGYRALRFARNDRTPLSGFEENDYVRNANFDACSLQALVDEYEALRRSHISLFGNLSDEAWSRSGSANNSAVSVRALAYIIAGHERHHVTILRKRLAGVS
ncbi:MAG: DinB family protein [Gemmataceae bacterium]